MSESTADRAVPRSWMAAEYEPGLVSVVIPTRNRGSLIADALASLLAQSHRPLEILVVDDGSEDDTAEVVAGWARIHADAAALRVRYIRQKHSGAPTARNRGCLESRGEFIQFLDSDDTIHPQKLALQLAALTQRSDFSVAYGPWRCLYENGRGRWHQGPPHQSAPEESEEQMLLGYVSGRWYCPSCSYLFRRDAVSAIGPWNTDLLIRQDTDYLIRTLLGRSRFLYVPGAWAYYRRHSGDHIGSEHRFIRGLDSTLDAILAWNQLIAANERADDLRGGLVAWLRALSRQSIARSHPAGALRCREVATAIVGAQGDQGFATDNVSKFFGTAGRRVKGWVTRLVGELGIEWARYALNRATTARRTAS